MVVTGLCTESNGFLKSQGRGLPSSKLNRNSGARHPIFSAHLGLARQHWPVFVTTDSPEVVCTVPQVHPWPLLSAQYPRLGQVARSPGASRKSIWGGGQSQVPSPLSTYIGLLEPMSPTQGTPAAALASLMLPLPSLCAA